MNAPINLVAEVLKKHKIEQAVIREILEDIHHEIAPDADEDVAPPAPKKQFVVILSAAAFEEIIGRTFEVAALVEKIPQSNEQLRAFVAVQDFFIKIRQTLAQDLTGWCVQIPENASPFSTMDRVLKAAYDFNASKKGRLLPVKTVGEALESASAKYFKEAELWIKTKLPVAVIVTNNQIPRDEFQVERVDRRRSE
jgi:hypothetical protein